MKKSEKNVNQQLILLFCFLLFFICQPAKSAVVAGDYQLQRTNQTKYVDKYFEVDGNGDYKIHIFLGEQKIATADNEEDIAYPINDHLGSPTVITNQVGAVVETNDYESYGQLKNTNSNLDNDYKFTGKELDEESGLQYYGARYYDNKVGRFISMDSLDGDLTNPQSMNKYSYAFNNPVIYIDPTGESGELSIYTISNDITNGHAWMSYIPDNTGEMSTYGTWGNDPDGKGNGLLKNYELGKNMKADISRTLHIDDDGETKFFDVVQSYEDAGDDAWKILEPCSAFAQDAWEAGTGEYLKANTFIINNPDTLSKSIIKMNGGQNHNTPQTDNNDTPIGSHSSFSNNSLNSSAHSSYDSTQSRDKSVGKSLRKIGEYLNPVAQKLYLKFIVR